LAQASLASAAPCIILAISGSQSESFSP